LKNRSGSLENRSFVQVFDLEGVLSEGADRLLVTEKTESRSDRLANGTPRSTVEEWTYVSEFTTCVIPHRNGRDCNRPVVHDAPLPLCARHLQEAFLFVSDCIDAFRLADGRPDLVFSQMPPKEDRSSVIYYVRIGYHIKIGTTVDLTTRMNSLMPDHFLATEPGDRDLERRRHDQFRHLLAKGREYFNPGPDLLAHIASLRATSPKMADR
jgi:hypothetical protein